MGIESQTMRYDDKSLSERLFPVYVKTGTVSAVHDFCQKTLKITGSKPTLHKMADYFSWKTMREEQLRSAFSVVSGNSYEELMGDLTALKDSAKQVLKTSPSDEKAQSQLGKHIGQILNIKRAMAQERAVDPNVIMLKIFEGLLDYYAKAGNEQVVEIITTDLDALTEHIKNNRVAT